MSAVLGVAPLLATENSLFKAIGEIFHPLFLAIADVLAFIYGIVPNYAVAIVILTILIMALLTPLTIKSTRSMLAMQALQPELQKLRQKYKGPENREQLNQEMMRLYREQGVSPTGGCLPMFLQMPALIVLYDTLKGLTNTITRGQAFPTRTLLRNGTWVKAGTKCTQAVCAVPRYIPTSSKMYHNLVATPGVMHSLGLNLALKPFSHHAFWYEYVPYFAFVAVAVALQYIQMSQMTKRNPAAAQANPQMQTMQKIMPLIFAYIYFLIPVGVVIYMIVSTLMRIGTQDIIFRTGIVQRPGERQIGGTAKTKPARAGILATLLGAPATAPAAIEARAAPAEGGNGTGKTTPSGGSGGQAAESGGAGSGATGTSNGAGPGRGGAAGGSGRQRQAARSGGRNRGARGREAAGANGTGTGTAAPKPHPRSKAKRARKAR